MADDYPRGMPISDPVGTWQPPKRDDERPGSEDDAKVQWALKQMSGAQTTKDKWVKQAKECDRFAANKHFTDADKAALNADQRMSAVFNAAQKWLRFVSGIEEKSQIETCFLPRDPHSDPQGMAAELMSKAHAWAVSGCDGDRERSRAFSDMVRRGMGWTYVMLNCRRDVSGVVELHRVDGMEMLWDPNAEKENGADFSWVARERQMPKDEVLRRWPDAKTIIGSADTGGAGDFSYLERPTNRLLNDKSAGPGNEGHEGPISTKKGHVKVVEFQWCEPVRGIYFYDPIEAKDDWLSEAAFGPYRKKYQRIAPRLRAAAQDPAAPYDLALRAAYLALPDDLEFSDQLMDVFKSMLLIGEKCVAKTGKLTGNRFSYNAITGQWDDEEKMWFGFFQLLLDPQRYMVKFANLTMDILNRIPKGGVIIEEGAVTNPAQFEQEYAGLATVSYVRDGAISGGKIHDKPMPQIPQGTVEMFQVCLGLMNDVTGINPEVQMGMGAADQPALTMQQRQGAGLLLLSQEFGALRRYRRAEAETLLAYLQLIADDRWIRIGGLEDSEAIQLVKAPFYLEYDVILDEGTRDPAVRAGFWRDFLTFGPQLQKMGLSVERFFDYAPLPASDRRAIKKDIQQQKEQKKQMAMQGIQDSGRGKPTSITEIKAREQLIQAQGELARAKAAKLISEVQGSKGQQILDGLLKGLDAGHGMAAAQQGMQHDATKFAMQSQHDTRKAQLDMALAGQKAKFEDHKQQMETSRAAIGAGLDIAKTVVQTHAAIRKADETDNGDD